MCGIGGGAAVPGGGTVRALGEQLQAGLAQLQGLGVNTAGGGPGAPALPPGVSPLPAPPSAMKPAAPPAGAPTTNAKGDKLHYFTHAGDSTPRAYDQTTVNFHMLPGHTNDFSIPGGGPAGKPGQFPGQFPGLPGQFPGLPAPFPGFPGQFGCHGPFGPFGPPPSLPGGVMPGMIPGSPHAKGLPRPAGVQLLPAPPEVLKPVAAPSGAPTTDSSGGKLHYFNHIADQTPRAYNQATVDYYGLKTA